MAGASSANVYSRGAVADEDRHDFEPYRSPTASPHDSDWTVTVAATPTPLSLPSSSPPSMRELLLADNSELTLPGGKRPRMEDDEPEFEDDEARLAWLEQEMAKDEAASALSAAAAIPVVDVSESGQPAARLQSLFAAGASSAGVTLREAAAEVPQVVAALPVRGGKGRGGKRGGKGRGKQDDEVAPPAPLNEYVVVKGVVNLTGARSWSRTAGLWGMKWGSMTYGEILCAFETRATREVGDGIFSTDDLWSESSSAREDGEKRRLVTGFHGGCEDLHKVVVTELMKGVPMFLCGFAAAGLPKKYGLRYVLTGEIPMLLDFDLVASHLRMAYERALQRGVRVPALAAFVSGDRGIAKQVEETRLAYSAFLAVDVSEVKQIANALSYGNTGAAFCSKHRMARLPDELNDLRREFAAIRTTDVRTEGNEKKLERMKARKPRGWELSLYSAVNEAMERRVLDKAEMFFEEHGMRFVGYNGDGGLVLAEFESDVPTLLR